MVHCRLLEPSHAPPFKHARCRCAANGVTVTSVQAAPMEVDCASEPPASQPPLPCLITRLCGAVHRSPSPRYPPAAQSQVRGQHDPNAMTTPPPLSSIAAASHQGLGRTPPLPQPSPRTAGPHQLSHQGFDGIHPPSQPPAASHANFRPTLVQPSPTASGHGARPDQPAVRLMADQVSHCSSQP